MKNPHHSFITSCKNCLTIVYVARITMHNTIMIIRAMNSLIINIIARDVKVKSNREHVKKLR